MYSKKEYIRIKTWGSDGKNNILHELLEVTAVSIDYLLEAASKGAIGADEGAPVDV